MKQEKQKNSKILSCCDRVAELLSAFMMGICVIVFLIMVYAVAYGVIGRYVPFIKNPRWTQELAILCMVWLCFLGAGYAIKEGLHVRMTIINFVIPARLASFLHNCAYILLFIVNVVWIVYGIQLMKMTKIAKMAATGWPLGITYLSVVIGGFYGGAMAAYRIVKGGL